MEDKAWTVVQFIEDKSVEAVPSGWVQGNFCHWPPFSRDKLISFIRKSEPLNTCWPSHEVKVFRNSTFDNYAKARSKAKLAEETSDLASDASGTVKCNGGKIKRKRIQKVLSTSESSISDSSLLPTPPKLSSKILKYNEDKNDKKILNNVKITSKLGSLKKIADHNVALNNAALTLNQASDNMGIPMELTEKLDISTTSFEKSNVNNLHLDEISTDNFSGNSRSQLCSICNGSAADLVVLKQQNHILRSMISETLEEVKRLRADIVKERNTDASEKPQSIFAKYQDVHFPIATDDDFLRFEKILENTEEFQIASKEMSRFGGTNVYYFVKRVLSALTTNEIALQYSFLGRKGKKSFKNTQISKLVIVSAEKSNITNSITDTENAISTWLRRSSDRRAAIQKKFSTTKHLE